MKRIVLMMGCVALFGAAAFGGGGRPVFVNYDDTHFVHSRTKFGMEMTADEMRRMVRQYKGTDVTDLLFCIGGRIADVPNPVKESWIDKYHQTNENGYAVNYTGDMYARAAHEQYEVRKIDRVTLWLDEARKCGIRPWLSFRMNDCHNNSMPTNFLHPEFFHRHPEYRRIRHRPPELYFDRCFDYAFKPIRDRELGYIGEMLGRYDTDGVEIDWMREPYCFAPGQASCAVMTDFMREVRRLADGAAKRLGHPVKVLARVPADPETALGFGFDAATWADEKLVDVLVPCPRWETTDNEIATDLWKRLLRGTDVLLAPGVEIRIVRERPFYVSVEQLMGAAAWHYSAGADGFYLYNYFDDPSWKEGEKVGFGYWKERDQTPETVAPAWGNQVRWLRMIGHPDEVLAAPRDHVLTYHDIVPLWGSREHALPVKLGKGWLHYFRLATGVVPSGRQLKLRLGVVGDAKLRVFANSRPCEPLGTEKCEPALTDAPLRTFSVPDFTEDSLVVEVKPDAPVEITFLDLQVRPRREQAVTLHVILQSHLDPVWLWNREQGVDAAIATARTMCDILDDYPETHMTRGEAWIYECCEKYDPETFRRLKAHVAGGRLHVVGGEYVQPDCNLPVADAFADHLSFARRYFNERVGVPHIQTGYNPDSFGHGAYLPRFLSDAGMRNYLFMRPGAHEKSLPGEIFRWRSPDGAEVLAARIDGCYNPSSADDAMYWQVTNAVARCDRRIGHCFTMIGVGDHGGGPARAQVDWILKHRGEWPDVKVVFSHPDAFFAAVRAAGVELPVVTGELQHHAIGCYSALSRIKREVRETEDALRRDGELLPADVLDDCRAKLYFATFHDILGGCSIASAYPDIYDSLGYVRSVCRDARLKETRRRNAKLPPAKFQRVIFDNPGKGRWRGVTEFEAWLKSNEGWYSWTEALNEKLCLRDADGHVVPIQFVPHRDKSGRPQPNLAIFLDLAPGETRTYSLCYDGEGMRDEGRGMSDGEVPRWRFEVIEDKTDTWSHYVNGYPAATRTMARTGEKRPLTTGCILAETLEEYADPSGKAFVRVRQERGLPGVRLKARVVWSEPREIVKLAIEPGFAVTGRIDRVAGGNVVRALDGEEWPFAGAVTLLGANGRRFSVVCRDVTALDVQKDGTVRLTLFRTPPYSEHVPAKVSDASCPVTDLGEHFFDIQVLRDASDEQIEDALYSLASPLVFSETTKGVGK